MKKLSIATLGLAVGLVACGGGQTTTGGGGGGAQRERPASLRVEATEYAFTGLPGSIGAGKTTFEMQNVGQEPHMIFFARIEGTTKSVPELLELSDKESQKFVEEIGGIQKPVAPGKAGEVTLTLEPGRYVYLCFISAPDGDAHYEKGMFGEVTVQ